MSEAPVTENKKRFREIDVLYALGALARDTRTFAPERLEHISG